MADITVAGHPIKLTSLDRDMYPPHGFTKAEVIEYYLAVAPALGLQLAGRPLTRKRWPHGVGATWFFEKNSPSGTPDWLHTTSLGSDPIDYPVIDADTNLPALVWFAQLGVLELHTPQWRVDDVGAPQPPDRLVIDLDPGAPAGLAQCQSVALTVRAVLADFGFTAQPVLSGSKGMQLYADLSATSAVPLGSTSADVAAFVRHLAVELSASDPMIEHRMTKSLRVGRVFLDHSQNVAAKTTITPYSLRGTSAPHAAAPVTWDEVANDELRQFHPSEVLDRLADFGDLLAVTPQQPPE